MRNRGRIHSPRSPVSLKGNPMYDTIKRPPGPEVTRHFKIHSLGAMKAFKANAPDGSPAMYLEGIASSTVRDRHGDTITANAQAQMLEAAKGLTMWLNHSYDVPEDILGTCEESSLVSGTDQGSDCLDLTIRCKIDANNPRAVKTWQHVNGGTQLGFSIGGEITQFEFDEENDDGSSWCPPMIIDGLALYEISCVGIPANPRAYTRTFVEEMSRGMMRTVARDKSVRDIVMKTYAERRNGVAEVSVFDPESPQTGGIDALLASGAPTKIAGEVGTSGTAGPIIRGLAADAASFAAGLLLCAIDGFEARLVELAGRSYVVEKSTAGLLEIIKEASDSKKPYGNVEYADPGYQSDGVHRYPLDTAEHIKAAASYFGQQKNRDQYTSSQQKAIESRIEAAERRHGIGDHSAKDDAKKAALVADIMRSATAIGSNNVEALQKAIEEQLALAFTRDAADGDPDSDDLAEPHAAKVASAVMCLNASIGHGMCAASLGHTTAAHAILTGMLPEDYPYPTDMPSAEAPGDIENALTLTLRADLSEVKAQVQALGDELTAKRAELEQISTTATRRAAEVTAAEAKIADLTSEQTELQKTIDQLKATPTGRQTALSVGSSERAGTYVKRTETRGDARKQLAVALHGGSVGDATLRPV